jgi:choline dehydrogenase
LPSARGPGCTRAPGFTVSVVHLRPDARGDVRLKSAGPLAPPAIRFNFLKTSHDLKALTAGLRLARKIVNQPALSGYVAGN